MMKATVAAAAAALLLLAGCGGGGARSPQSKGVTPLAVRSVQWNATNARVGKVHAVTDDDEVAAVFADDGAHIFTSGALVATDAAITDWTDADTILGPDGTARWIVGMNKRGRLFHLRGRSSFEDVSERYGLGGRRIRDAALLGSAHVGFLVDNEVAIADGTTVTRYGSPTQLFELAGGGGFGAGVSRDRLFVFTARHRGARFYSLPNVTHAVLGPDGRLYATTPRAVYATDHSGDLIRLYETSRDSIHGLVASAEHIWFADGTELGVVDGTAIAMTKGANVAPDAKLAPSTTGDVWVLASGKLTRFARLDPEPELERAWKDKLSGVFARSCAACHMSNGPAGIDLSNAEAWHSRRTVIHDRVIVSHSMPPQGHVLSEADFAAVRVWSEATAP